MEELERLAGQGSLLGVERSAQQVGRLHGDCLRKVSNGLLLVAISSDLNTNLIHKLRLPPRSPGPPRLTSRALPAETCPRLSQLLCLMLLLLLLYVVFVVKPVWYGT